MGIFVSRRAKIFVGINIDSVAFDLWLSRIFVWTNNARFQADCEKFDSNTLTR
jgi:hypothetical protein